MNLRPVIRRLSVPLVLGLSILFPACSASPPPPRAPESSSELPTEPRRLITSADGSERVAELPVGTVASASSKRVLLSERVVLRPGQVMLAVAEFQVTNDLDANIFVGSQVVLAKDSQSTSGLAVTEAGGQNVTPDVHHGHFSRTGMLQARTTDAGDRWINVVAWASSSRAVPGSVLRVDRGYGRLTITSL